MQFPVPQQFMPGSPHLAAPSDSESQLESLQWEKFDDLFDKVFATPTKTPPRSNARPSEGSPGHASMPGGFHGRRLFRSMSSGEESSSEESFDHVWDDAVRKAKRTITTTTKRRIIRHTPTKLDMPSPAPTLSLVRGRFPKTPYPQRPDESPEDSSNDSDSDDHPKLSTSVARPSASAGPPPNVASLQIPDTGLTPELHSPVKYVPEWKREPRLDPYIPPESPWVTTTFDMPEGLTKNDIRVAFTTTYGAEKVTVSWQHVDILEFVEGGKLVREKKERKYHRALPLPKGVKFEHVTANLGAGVLTITHPRMPKADLRRVRPVEVLQLTR